MCPHTLQLPPPTCSTFEIPDWFCSVLPESFTHRNFVWIRKEQEMQDLVSRKHWSRSHRVVEHPRERRAQPKLQCYKRLDLQHAPQGSFLIMLVFYLWTAGQRKWGQIYLQSCPNHAFIFFCRTFSQVGNMLLPQERLSDSSAPKDFFYQGGSGLIVKIKRNAYTWSQTDCLNL